MANPKTILQRNLKTAAAAGATKAKGNMARVLAKAKTAPRITLREKLPAQRLSVAQWEILNAERKKRYPKRRKKICACGCGREVHSVRAGVWRLYATTSCAVRVSNREKKKKLAGHCTDCGERLYADNAARCKVCNATIGKQQGYACQKDHCTNRIAMCSGKTGRPPMYCSRSCADKGQVINNRKNLRLFKRALGVRAS